MHSILADVAAHAEANLHYAAAWRWTGFRHWNIPAAHLEAPIIPFVPQVNSTTHYPGHGRSRVVRKEAEEGPNPLRRRRRGIKAALGR